MKAAEAMPPARLSAVITSVNARGISNALPNTLNCHTSCATPGMVLSQANSRLLSADSTAPSISTRITPMRKASTPPMKVPSSVKTMPNTPLTSATCSLLNCMST